MEKMKITVEASGQTVEYESDHAVMVLLDWQEDNQVSRTLCLSSPEASSHLVHAIGRCADELEGRENPHSKLIGKSVNAVLSQGVHQLVDLAKAVVDEEVES